MAQVEAWRATNEVPEAPGPPGSANSEPIFAPVAFLRSSAICMVFPSPGCA